MKIAVFGLGYVGVVSTACLVRDGHTVRGVDPVQSKVKDVAAGRSPVSEPNVAELLAAGHASGLLCAQTAPTADTLDCDMVWICVGTPSAPDGAVRLDSVLAAAGQIGEAMRGSGHRPLIVLRSTVVPGTTADAFIPAVELAAGLAAGVDFDVVFHPEFLREGSAVADFDAPPKIVIGEQRAGAGDKLMALYGDGYAAPRFRLTLPEAELVKYCDNLFHAVKVTFANEVGLLARSAGVDARCVAEVFLSDTKLNISPRYLRPGFAFGGSCLPKDLRAVLRYATTRSIHLPMLSSVPASNAMQIESLVSRVLERAPRRVGLVGLAFKPGTDDMRESPYVTVAKRLIGEGVTVRIFDPGIALERLIGSNKQAVQSALGHLASMLVTTDSALDDCDLVLVNHPVVDQVVVQRWRRAGVYLIDLVGIPGVPTGDGDVEGIAW